MPQSSQNSSFIPKHSPNTKPKSKKKGSPAIFSIITGILFGAVLIASAALLAYEWYLGNQFDDAVLQLNQAAESFSESDLSRVVDFDTRLTAANQLFAEHVSITRVLEELARQTVNSLQFSGVSIERVDRSTILVEAEVSADELGSILVQRNAYDDSEVFTTALFEDLALNFAPPIDPDEASQSDSTAVPSNFVEAAIELEFPIDSVLYDGIRSVSAMQPSSLNSTNNEDSLLEDGAAIENIDL